MGFKVQEKKNAVTLDVEKVLLNGEIVTKKLVFDCSPGNLDYVRGVKAAMKSLEELNSRGVSIADIEPLVEAERSAFEAAAPGKWDEYFDFLDHNYVDMGMLVTHIFNLVMHEHVEAITEKQESAAPVIPEDGEKI